MLCSQIIYREVVNVANGEKIGYVSDIEFCGETGSIQSIFVPEKSRKFFQGKKGTKISWDSIRKIGDDIILVDVTDNLYKTNY